MQTYAWQKPTHGRLTLSTPLLFESSAVASVDPFQGFGLGVSQFGAEAAYYFSTLNDGRLRSTMLTAALLNGVTDDGEAAVRNTGGGIDVYVQGLQLFGDRNTVGGFYYRGRSALASVDPAGARQRFARYGVVGNYLLMKRLDLVAGTAFGWDRSPFLSEDQPFAGVFAEAVAQLTPAWIAVYRFDGVDPNRDAVDDDVRAHTASTTLRADEHLYITGEVQRRWLGSESLPWSLIVNARLTF